MYQDLQSKMLENGFFVSVKEANKFGITSILDAGTESIKQKKSENPKFEKS